VRETDAGKYPRLTYCSDAQTRALAPPQARN
jgi:hypothetical protein